MKFNNLQIYQIAGDISANFDKSNLYIPAQANFYLQKNIQTISNAAAEIERYRLQIAQAYGTLDETQTQFIVPEDKSSVVAEELNDLFALEQDLSIIMIPIAAFKNVVMSEQQIKAIMFMIKN